MKLSFFLSSVLLSLTVCASVALTQDDGHPWKIEDVDSESQLSSALRTGSIGASETTSVTITFNTETDEYKEFYVKTSTESGCDCLTLDIDGESWQYSGDGDDWQYVAGYSWNSGEQHTITLTYTKDGSVDGGSDCCWIWFSGIEDLALGDAEVSGSWGMDKLHPWQIADWMTQSNNSGKDIPYMKSPSLSDGESSWISHSVEGVTTFSFWYTISSEENSDYLRVMVDGEEVASFSGDSWYSSYDIALPDKGRHVIKWTYEKDSNGSSSGDDCAYVWYDGIEEIMTAGYSMNLVYPWVEDDAETESSGWGHAPLRSGTIPDGESTSFSVTIEEERMSLRFGWKCSSEEGHDKLRLFKNGELVRETSGEKGWEFYSIVVVAGDVLTWQYEKDDNGTSCGQDCGWVNFYRLPDFVKVMDYFRDDNTAEVSQTIAFDLNTGRSAQQSILNASDGMAFTSGVERLCWHVDESVGYSGRSLKSGRVKDGESSYLQTTVIGAGTVTFHWKVSSEENCDMLSYYVDGELQGSISGETGWSEVSVNLTEDTRHVIKWEYVKDSSMSAGSDCGWVDGLTWNAPQGYDDPDEPIVPASVSTFIPLDLTPSPNVTYRHLIKSPKTIVFSPDWSKASSVVLKVNGQAIRTATASGTYDWTPTTSGTYVFTLEQLDAEGGAVADPLTYTFEIKQIKGVFIGIY